MRVLALVTARGGSKGFPGKNLACLAGRPLVAWAHRALAALRDRHPGLVVHLSTDSAEIAACWPESDRPRRLRPAELSADDTTSLAVVEHELATMDAAGVPCDTVLLLQPTSPLIETDDLDRAWALYATGAESVAGVAEVAHPIAWSMYLRDGVLHAPLPELSGRRRQELEAAFCPVGFWMVSRDFLARHRTFAVPGLTHGCVVPVARAVDIDRAIDLDLARVALSAAKPPRRFRLGTREVGDGAPCFVIAEAGVNHNGDPDLASQLIRAAAAAGADAVKFQTFRADELVTAGARKAAYQAANTGADDGQLGMLRRLEFPPAIFRRLKSEAEDLGLVFLSTPFEGASAQVLADLGVVGFKLGSGEATNLPFLAQIAGYGRPMLLSTGMCDLDEVMTAVAVIRAHGDPPLGLLHCVSTYPAPADQSNLRAMESLRLACGGPVGMSDHSLGWEVALAAVALGARVIEKHLTTDRRLPGPDHAASIEPDELAEMMRQLRRVESALGDGVKRPMSCEMDTRTVARKSLVAARDLPAGGTLTATDLAVKRPGTGIAPGELAAVLGTRLRRAIACDEVLAWADLDRSGAAQ